MEEVFEQFASNQALDTVARDRRRVEVLLQTAESPSLRQYLHAWLESTGQTAGTAQIGDHAQNNVILRLVAEPKAMSPSKGVKSEELPHDKAAAFQYVEELKEKMKGRKMLGVPTMKEIQKWFATEESAVEFLMQEGMICWPTSCPKCQAAVKIDKKNEVRCRSRSCLRDHGKMWSQSIFMGSFFMCHGKKGLMEFIYHWLCGATTQTIQTYNSWAHQKLQIWLENLHQQLVPTIVTENQKPIGGNGIVVEIHEAAFGKRKGYTFEDTWVFFGGVEVTKERRIFAAVVATSDEATLLPLINKFIAPGSVITSDLWEVYDNTGYYADTWTGMKKLAPVSKWKRNKKNLPGSLIEFIWRRNNEGNLWGALIKALKEGRCDVGEDSKPRARKVPGDKKITADGGKKMKICDKKDEEEDHKHVALLQAITEGGGEKDGHEEEKDGGKLVSAAV